LYFHRRLGADNPTVRVVFEAESPQDVSLARFTASHKNTRGEILELALWR
jgi:hypothetical protein